MRFFTLGLFLAMALFEQSWANPVSWWDMSPPEVREKINARIMSVEAPVPSVFSVADRTLSCPVRIYTPDSSKNCPVILFIHGGAWVAGNLDTHDNLARYLCSEAHAIVVSVGYTNAPEGKFPLALEQCYDTLKWIAKEEYPGSKIAVVGDSAGANMAAALCLMDRDRSGPPITLQALINPATDLSCEGTITRQNDALDILRWQAFQYVVNPEDVNNPYVSPLMAKDVSKLPPAVVILAELDPLRESGQKYADRLQAYVYCQKGVNHLAGDGARASNVAKESLDVAVAQIKKAFGK